jgi:DNA (cytosine-5)-methyltransferase 1
MAELGYSIAWRVLDAQNFGVAQRRRRVFVVGCSSGDWRDPSSVLFEQSCGNWDSTQSRKAREETTGSLIPSTAGSLDTQCGGGKLTHQSAANGHLIISPAEKMGTITARMFNALGARDIEEGAVQAVSAFSSVMSVPSCSTDEKAPTLLAKNPMAVAGQVSGVRKLTPIEVERLQGFPDGHTDIFDKTPDGPRYKAMGNSMAVPVMRWIGERIEQVSR